jgi:hypothetical protein
MCGHLTWNGGLICDSGRTRLKHQSGAREHAANECTGPAWGDMDHDANYHLSDQSRMLYRPMTRLAYHPMLVRLKPIAGHRQMEAKSNSL